MLKLKTLIFILIFNPRINPADATSCDLIKIDWKAEITIWKNADSIHNQIAIILSSYLPKI